MTVADHEWSNYHDEIFATDDDAEAERLRRVSQTADYFLGSVTYYRTNVREVCEGPVARLAQVGWGKPVC